MKIEDINTFVNSLSADLSAAKISTFPFSGEKMRINISLKKIWFPSERFTVHLFNDYVCIITPGYIDIPTRFDIKYDYRYGKIELDICFELGVIHDLETFKRACREIISIGLRLFFEKNCKW